MQSAFFMSAASQRSADADIAETSFRITNYKNRTPLTESKILTAERTLKFVFTASQWSADADIAETSFRITNYYKFITIFKSG